MLTLAGRATALRNVPGEGANIIIRVSDNVERPRALRNREAFLVSNGTPPSGFGLYLALKCNAERLDFLTAGTPALTLPDTFAYLADGDVLRIRPGAGEVRALYRRN
jgi:hypothetical protein